MVNIQTSQVADSLAPFCDSLLSLSLSLSLFYGTGYRYINKSITILPSSGEREKREKLPSRKLIHFTVCCMKVLASFPAISILIYRLNVRAPQPHRRETDEGKRGAKVQNLWCSSLQSDERNRGWHWLRRERVKRRAMCFSRYYIWDEKVVLLPSSWETLYDRIYYTFVALFMSFYYIQLWRLNFVSCHYVPTFMRFSNGNSLWCF